MIKDIPAFPTGETITYTGLTRSTPGDPCEKTVAINQGMTLRDYMAANALQGLCVIDDGTQIIPKKIAELSYEIADAMLEARDANS